MNHNPEEQTNDIELDGRLRGFDLSHRSRIRQSLRHRLAQQGSARQQPFSGEPHMQTTVQKRWGLALASLALLMVLTVAFVPPVKAAAAGLLRQIGQFILVDRAPAAEDLPPVPEGQPTAEPPAFADIVALDLAEASQAAGFSGLEPAALPEGYALTRRVVQAVPDGVSLYSVFQNGASLLSLAQVQYEPGAEPQEFWTGGTTLTETSVRGQSGMWIEDVRLGVANGPDGQTSVLPMDLLMWAEDGFTFWMASTDLSLEQVLAAAESLQ